MQIIAAFVLGPVWQGVLAATLMFAIGFFLPFFHSFAILVMALVTLRQGMQKGLHIMLGGILLGVSLGVSMLYMIADLQEASLGFYDLYFYSLEYNLYFSVIIWALAGLLRLTVSLNFVSRLFTGFMAAMLAFSLLTGINIMPNLVNLVSQSLETAMHTAINNNEAMQQVYGKSAIGNLWLKDNQKNIKNKDFKDTQNTIDTIDTVDKKNIINTESPVSSLLTLNVYIFIYLIFISMLFIARAWQSKLFMPGEFKKDFINLRAGKSMALVFVCFWLLASILIKYNVFYGSVLFIVVSFLSVWLTICSAAYLHWVFDNFKIKWYFIVCFYVSLMLIALILPIIAFYIAAIAILLALVDGFINIRYKTLNYISYKGV